MEKDIEMLENVMEGFRKAEFAQLDYIEDLCQRFDYEDYIAVKNLINRVKELEIECESKEKAYNDCYCEYKHYKQFESIPKSKIKKDLKKVKEIYEKEMKPYQRDCGLDVTYLSKKEKEELINTRNCLIVQMETYKQLLEEES